MWKLESEILVSSSFSSLLVLLYWSPDSNLLVNLFRVLELTAGTPVVTWFGMSGHENGTCDLMRMELVTS